MDDGEQGERAFLAGAAAERGIDVAGLLVTRVQAPGQDRVSSGLRYAPGHGAGATRVALLHGGGQNAHTWDLVAAALGTDALALDLPGHGRSVPLPGDDYGPRNLAGPVTTALEAICPDLQVLVGASLGGMVAVACAEAFPRLRHLVTVDVSPGSVVPEGSSVRAVTALGPAPFDELVRRVAALTSGRAPQGLRHAVWHNTKPVEAGRAWRRDPRMQVGSFQDLWPEYEGLAPSLTAVVAGSGSFVPANDLRRVRALLPGRVHLIEGATHSVQTSRPLQLAAVLRPLLQQ